MVEPLIIGAIAGGVLGLIVLIVLIVFFVYLSRRLRKRTNVREKLITSGGDVVKDKWSEEFRGQKTVNGKRLYFDQVDNTEHVEVVEKRRMEEFIAEHPAPPPPPPAPPMGPPPKLRRYQVRMGTWPRKKPQTVRRRPSLEKCELPKQHPMYYMYGYPYYYPRVVQPTPEPAKPKPEPPKVHDIEEQERAMIINDAMTEKTFNPRWVSASSGGAASEEVCTTTTTTTTSSDLVPRIETTLEGSRPVVVSNGGVVGHTVQGGPPHGVANGVVMHGVPPHGVVMQGAPAGMTQEGYEFRLVTTQGQTTNNAVSVEPQVRYQYQH